MLYISSTFTKDKTPFKKTLSVCAKNNINNIEIGSNHCYEKNLDYINDFSNLNFIVHNYFPVPKHDFVVNIASLNDELRKKSLSHIINSIDFCKKINASLLTFHPGFLTDPSGAKLFSKNYDFNWNRNALKNTDYKNTFNNMISSLEEIIDYANNSKIRISIETEGSFNQNQHLIMQKPEEYEKLFTYFSKNELGINCNIGHLNLASKFFKFSKQEFLNLIEKYITSFELSHNNGIEDEHKPLEDNEWYWDVICSKKFKDKIKILEFRNQSIHTVKKSIGLFNKKVNEAKYKE